MTSKPKRLRPPVPFFGSKYKIAETLWQDDFLKGDSQAYIEPFFGMGSVLFAKPQPSKYEIVCDNDHYIVNAWRAIQRDPDAVAFYCDGLISTAEFYARAQYVCQNLEHLRELECNPDFYDARIAGYWAYAVSTYIGRNKVTSHAYEGTKVPKAHPDVLTVAGVFRKEHAEYSETNDNTGLKQYLYDVAQRLRSVRVMWGNWQDAVKPSILAELHKHTNDDVAIFLDPPYSDRSGGDLTFYSNTDVTTVADTAKQWAIQHGERYRIVFCGYEGEHTFPDDWRVVAWSTGIGYRNRNAQSPGALQGNHTRERLWLSPKCRALSTRSQEGTAHADIPVQDLQETPVY